MRFLLNLGLAFVIIGVNLCQYLFRALFMQFEVLLLVLLLQGQQVIIKFLLGLSAPFGFPFGLVGGLALTLGILVLVRLVPVVFLLGQAERVLQFLGLLEVSARKSL